MGIRNGMKHIGKGKIGCFLYGLVPMGNHAVCQKGGNRYERLTLYGLVPMGNHAVCQKGGNRYERLTRLRNMVWFCTFQKRKDGIK